MNSGCYEHDISQVLLSIKAIDKKKLSEIEIKKDDIKFLYRGTNLSQELIITSAKLRGVIKKKEEIEKKQNLFIEMKKKSQPSQIKTCGSTFKNTQNKKAWQLIRDAKCNQASFGKASISKKHCNFFVNEGGASSEDIEKLINFVRKKVYEKFKVKLDLELKIIGETKKNV